MATVATPQYLNVKNHLREGISQGRWRAGERLPSEAELVAEFSLSRMTVNRALRELEQDGLVERVQGVGSFVAQLGRVASTLTVRDIQEEIKSRGHHHEARLLLLTTLKATVEQAALFGLKSGTPLFHSVIVHLENGRAIQCEDRLVNPACAPEYLQQDFAENTPTSYLLEVAPLAEARYTIESRLPSEQEASWLGIGRRTPCLVVTRRTSNRATGRNQTVTWVRLTHPGPLYSIEGIFQP